MHISAVLGNEIEFRKNFRNSKYLNEKLFLFIEKLPHKIHYFFNFIFFNTKLNNCVSERLPRHIARLNLTSYRPWRGCFITFTSGGLGRKTV